MAASSRTWIAAALAALALAGVAAGFFATWESQSGSAGRFGSFFIHYRLGDLEAGGNGARGVEGYSAEGVSPQLRQTMQETRALAWASAVAALACVALLAAPLLGFPAPLKGRLAQAGLALFVVLAVACAALFAYNFPRTEEGSPEGSTSFWGSDAAMTWGPGFAWYADAAAAVLGLAALVVSAMPEARSAP